MDRAGRWEGMRISIDSTYHQALFIDDLDRYADFVGHCVPCTAVDSLADLVLHLHAFCERAHAPERMGENDVGQRMLPHATVGTLARQRRRQWRRQRTVRALVANPEFVRLDLLNTVLRRCLTFDVDFLWRRRPSARGC